MNKILDTNVLLKLTEEEIRGQSNFFYISHISLLELENIKTSGLKDENVKFQARRTVRLLHKYPGKWIPIYHLDEDVERFIRENYLPDNNDARIIADVGLFCEDHNSWDFVFETDDLLCNIYADNLIGIDNLQVQEHKEDEKKALPVGYDEVSLDYEQMAALYSGEDFGYKVSNNPYVIIRDKENGNAPVDLFKINEFETLEPVNAPAFKSRMFGKISPYKQDFYQKIAFDLLGDENKKIVMLRGQQGVGKSVAGLGYALSAIDRGLYNRLTIAFNPTNVRGAQSIGYRKGDTLDKMLDSGLGQILESKFGDNIETRRMIQDGILKIIPICDIRGWEATDEILYIMEAENATIDMMKLLVGRLGPNSRMIIDGDDMTQVDMSMYENGNNGMRRAIEVFQDEPWFGHVLLRNVYRSEMAAAADKL